MTIFGRLKTNKAQVTSGTEPGVVTEADYIKATSGVTFRSDEPLSDGEREKLEIALKANFGY